MLHCEYWTANTLGLEPVRHNFIFITRATRSPSDSAAVRGHDIEPERRNVLRDVPLLMSMSLPIGMQHAAQSIAGGQVPVQSSSYRKIINKCPGTERVETDRQSITNSSYA